MQPDGTRGCLTTSHQSRHTVSIEVLGGGRDEEQSEVLREWQHLRSGEHRLCLGLTEFIHQMDNWAVLQISKCKLIKMFYLFFYLFGVGMGGC